MKNNSRTALNILAIAVGMFGMAYASVPLYDIFCKMTGFGGTTMVATKIPDKVYDREFKVLFNTQVSPELSWDFKISHNTANVKVGESKLIIFEATNYGTEDVVGMASYNVVPQKLGAFFNKIQCFCFEQQLIRAGEKVTFPVSFFIDPAIMDDKTLDDVSEVTLSYTFLKYQDQSLARKDSK